jgi:streptogrisin D
LFVKFRVITLACLTLAAPLAWASPSEAAPPVTHWATDVAANAKAVRAAEDLQAALVPSLQANAASANRTAATQMSSDGIDGVAINDNGLLVSTASQLSTAAQAAITHTRGTVPVTVRKVAHSAAHLAALASRIESDLSYWTSQGITVSGWGEWDTTNKIAVQLANYTPEAATAIVARYGADAVLVPAESMQADASSSRSIDGSPWYGGDLINSGTAGCTSWFSVSGGGRDYAVTAGHCGGRGTVWTQFNQPYGTVDLAVWGGTVDAARIPVSSDLRYVWANPTYTTRTVTSVSSSLVAGALVCTDGGVDAEVCNVKVQAPNDTVTYNGHTIGDMAYGVQQNGKPAFTPGDSGGPVYTATANQTAEAQGLIAAHVTGNNAEGWFCKVWNVESALGVSVMH